MHTVLVQCMHWDMTLWDDVYTVEFCYWTALDTRIIIYFCSMYLCVESGRYIHTKVMVSCSASLQIYNRTQIPTHGLNISKPAKQPSSNVILELNTIMSIHGDLIIQSIFKIYNSCGSTVDEPHFNFNFTTHDSTSKLYTISFQISKEGKKKKDKTNPCQS